MKEKLIKTKSVLWRLLFRIHRQVEAPIFHMDGINQDKENYTEEISEDRFCVKFECLHWHLGSIKCLTVIKFENYLTSAKSSFRAYANWTGSTRRCSQRKLSCRTGYSITEKLFLHLPACLFWLAKILRRYFNIFKEAKNRFHGIDSGSLCSLRSDTYPIPTRFLAPIDCSKIRALLYLFDQFRWWWTWTVSIKRGCPNNCKFVFWNTTIGRHFFKIWTRRNNKLNSLVSRPILWDCPFSNHFQTISSL